MRRFSIYWLRSISLCGLLYHFVTELLLLPNTPILLSYLWQWTVEYFGVRIFFMTIFVAEVAYSRFHTGIHWAPVSNPISHKCLQQQPACLWAWFNTPVAFEVIGAPDSKNFGWVSKYFWKYSVHITNNFLKNRFEFTLQYIYIFKSLLLSLSKV